MNDPSKSKCWKLFWATLKHNTSSTLVKCNSMIISFAMPSYPNVTLFLCYLISEHWATARTLKLIWKSTTKFPKPDNIKHKPKNNFICSICEFVHRALILTINSKKMIWTHCTHSEWLWRWINQHDTSVGQRKNSESPTRIGPVTSRAPCGRSFHWAMRTRGEQGHLTEFIYDRCPACC